MTPPTDPGAGAPPARIRLAPVLAPIAGLPGLRAPLAELLARACGGTRLLDLLFHLPEGLVDRRYRPTLAEAEAGRIATLSVTVQGIHKPARPKQPWRVVVRDATGQAELVFFSRYPLRGLTEGAQIVASGRLERYGGRLSMAHPDHLLPREQAAQLPLIEAVWPLTAGLMPRIVASAMRQALERLPTLPEWLPEALLAREGWPDLRRALLVLHFPADVAQSDPALQDDHALAQALERARERLAYDEMLASQLARVLARRRNRSRPGRAIPACDQLREQALQRFGHDLTEAQKRALAEIDADLAAPTRMLRLLQGDVGAGKTLVAILAMLRVAGSGAQAALMAPTEILARQHHATLSRLSPLPVALLAGSIKGAARKRSQALLAAGNIKLAVGTHALFQSHVAFHDLALAVIDEQHRFGVEQRLMLGDKGERTDILVMTATPIPRTLLLTQWGEIEVSRLDGKPAGRQPIRTTLHGMSQLEGVFAGLTRALGSGAQVFWVCPLVSESEVLDVAAAEARHAELAQRFGPGFCGLAHGRQDVATREAALRDFARGSTRILVATTVIEVGVDVPAATIMVVEHAERFGLAQLHQLRGRVGRGSEASYCLLLHEDGITGTARERLLLLRDTDDGFRIADEDHRLRGGGDLMGKRQSGLPGFRFPPGPRFESLLRDAAGRAETLVAEDPGLAAEARSAFSLLLALFGRDEATRTLHSG